MDNAICGCPTDHEFIYHQADKCSLRLAVNNRIAISPPCPSCAAHVAREKELAGDLCLVRCPVCGSETAGSNETAINKKMHILQSRLSALEKVAEEVNKMPYASRTPLLNKALAALDAAKEWK